MASGSGLDVVDNEVPLPGDKRLAVTPGDDEPANKKLRLVAAHQHLHFQYK